MDSSKLPKAVKLEDFEIIKKYVDKKVPAYIDEKTTSEVNKAVNETVTPYVDEKISTAKTELDTKFESKSQELEAMIDQKFESEIVSLLDTEV